MIYVGIDVAKDKHDCFILNHEGEVKADVFTIANNAEGFEQLRQTIQACLVDELTGCSGVSTSAVGPAATFVTSPVRVGLEATGHYSQNILNYLMQQQYPTYLINPLHTTLYRKSLSLRKAKTDRIDARTIASMLASDVSLKPYTDRAHQNEELKALTRYRFDKVRERAKLKQSVSRLITILFPELENHVPNVHMASIYALLREHPGAHHIAQAHLTRLKTILLESSNGRYGRDKAVEIREAARLSIGSNLPVKSMELRHTIHLIGELDREIAEIEVAIDAILADLDSPITTIPGMGKRMGAIILAEVGDFANFDSADKVLAYAGLAPSTYQSGQLVNGFSHMEKRGSKYLRYAIFNATKFVCIWDPTFSAYLAKKRAEGKPYNVAISHAAKKLVRLMYALERSGESYRKGS